tara:strand:- start:264 stop:533 length:270 start_codon:yes stop_codon:yes gene_type:complete
MRKFEIADRRVQARLSEIASSGEAMYQKQLRMTQEVSKLMQLSPNSREDTAKKRLNAKVVGVVSADGQVFLQLDIYSHRRSSLLPRKIF